MQTLRYRTLVIAVLLVSAPLSIVITLALLPFWRWLEATLSIESVGHSGPADWCFLAVFLACSVALGCTGMLIVQHKGSKP